MLSADDDRQGWTFVFAFSRRTQTAVIHAGLAKGPVDPLLPFLEGPAGQEMRDKRLFLDNQIELERLFSANLYRSGRSGWTRRRSSRLLHGEIEWVKIRIDKAVTSYSLMNGRHQPSLATCTTPDGKFVTQVRHHLSLREIEAIDDRSLLSEHR